jgi:uncharacterized ion transporter superfamily protein YfcC
VIERMRKDKKRMDKISYLSHYLKKKKKKKKKSVDVKEELERKNGEEDKKEKENTLGVMKRQIHFTFHNTFIFFVFSYFLFLKTFFSFLSSFSMWQQKWKWNSVFDFAIVSKIDIKVDIS